MITNINELVKVPENAIVEFVHCTCNHSYSACSEQVTISINGNWVTLPEHSLRTGGGIWFDDDWGEHIDYGPWTIDSDDIPKNLIHLKSKIEQVINENVSPGCCGGCI